MKTLKYQRTEYSLTDEEHKRIIEVMTSPPRPFHINFRGNILKTSQVEVFVENRSKLNDILQNFWSVKELDAFKEEIELAGFFKKLLIKKVAWRISDRYPEGAVVDPKLYEELHKKYSALISFISKQQKENRSEEIKTIAVPKEIGEIDDKWEQKDRVDVKDIPF